MTLYMLNEIQRLIDAELARLRDEWIQAGKKLAACENDLDRNALERWKDLKQDDYTTFMYKVAEPFRNAQWKEW